MYYLLYINHDIITGNTILDTIDIVIITQDKIV